MTRSTVDMAVLSVVIERPGHGYDIGVRFVSRYYPLYRTTVQNVYTNLRRLREAGFIEPIDLEDEPPSHGQIRKASFRATAEGARSFRGWLASPMPAETARRELFTRLRALRPDDYGSMLRLLDRFEEAVLGSIGFISAAEPLTVVDNLAREDHEAAIEGALRWSAAAREQLRALIARETAG
ncbi:MAG: PadR family transcriptional regulator [Actinobacteria bacterium]|nr:PadR family transcriptional regulator [Actinomycetota bacterium]